MGVTQQGKVAVEFEAAQLSLADAPNKPRPRVGWFLQSLDIDSASTRYRCYHFATALRGEIDSSYFTSIADLQGAATRLDAIVIVKRLDRDVLNVAMLAKLHDLPLFLDLCDDLISQAYAKNKDGLNLLHFLGIAPLLSGVTVPSSLMAERVETYAASNGLIALPIHVIPDIAETWEIYRETYTTVKGNLPPYEPTRRTHLRTDDVKKVLWFGSFGASHSNFGMFSLMHSFKALRTVNAEISLELMIVSNSEIVYKALVTGCGFATRYVPWTPAAVYSALAEADVALLTTGDDEFCSIKSSNRALQALAAGVPVITPKGPSLAEFEDVIVTGKMLDSLRLSLGPKRQRAMEKRLAAARPILERYTPAALAPIWAQLLQDAVEARSRQDIVDAAGPVLFILLPGDSLNNVKAVLVAAKAIPELDLQLLVSTDLLESATEFQAIMRLPRQIPRFFSGDLKGAKNLIRGCSAVVLDSCHGSIGKTIVNLAKRLDVPLISSVEAAGGALEVFATKSPPASTSTTIAAGPTHEWAMPDGSVDWAFIVHQSARGWILDAICREIGSRQEKSWKVTYHPDNPPEARNLFFSHYLLLQNYIERHPERLDRAKSFVWYTHPRDDGPTSIAKLLVAFDKVTKVIFTCDSNRRAWVQRGLPEEKAALVLGAADPKLFRFHARGDGAVGLSSSFYERKNPDTLLQVVRLLPHRRFVLLGRRWNQYALFERLKALPNFEYQSVPYEDYPDLYDTFDVFLSISNLEGGPIPLIEAMMSNAVPVASKTGFAPDIIRHGENGFLFDIDAPAQQIAGFIEEAFTLEANVRETVRAYDWDQFSATIVALAE